MSTTKATTGWIELECECECGCGEAATTRDEGSYLCGACAEYTVDESGDVHCSREYDGATCPHCGAAIAWGPIQTHGPGEANDREGACECGSWYQADRGGWGVPAYESKEE